MREVVGPSLPHYGVEVDRSTGTDSGGFGVPFDLSANEKDIRKETMIKTNDYSYADTQRDNQLSEIEQPKP